VHIDAYDMNGDAVVNDENGNPANATRLVAYSSSGDAVDFDFLGSD